MTLKQYLLSGNRPSYDVLKEYRLVFNATVANAINRFFDRNKERFILEPTMIDQDTYFLTADCLTEMDGMFRNKISRIPTDAVTVVSPKDWLPYQAIIDARNQSLEQEG